MGDRFVWVMYFGLLDLQFAKQFRNMLPGKKSPANLIVAFTLKTAQVSISCPAVFLQKNRHRFAGLMVGGYRTTDHFIGFPNSELEFLNS